QAVTDASVGDTICFAVTGVIVLTNGELIIRTNLDVVGPGADNLTVMRSTAPDTTAFRIFNISGGTVSMCGLTISNGLVTGTAGASSFPTPFGPPAPGGAGGLASGGGILNQATLSLVRCRISGNSARGGGGGFGSPGGNGGSA